MKRTIGSVLAGVVTIGILTVAGDQCLPGAFPGAFDATGFTTNTAALAVMLAYTIVFSAIGGWVTATVARRPDLRGIGILAGVQLVITVVANAALWDRRLAWLHAIGAALTPVAILAGGRIRAARASTPASSSPHCPRHP